MAASFVRNYHVLKQLFLYSKVSCFRLVSWILMIVASFECKKLKFEVLKTIKGVLKCHVENFNFPIYLHYEEFLEKFRTS